MSLRALMINKKLLEKRAALADLQAMDEGFETREKDLEKAIEEASTEEESAVVDEAVDTYEKEKKGHDTAKKGLTEEIEKLEKELEEAEEGSRSAVPHCMERTSYEEMKGAERMKRNGCDVREQIRTRLMVHEVREFYADVARLVRASGDVAGSELLIPEVVINAIKMQIGDYSVLMKEVTVLPVPGTARVVMDGKIPEAIWTEMTGAVQELAINAFTAVELDGFKVGGYIPVHNSLIDDAMIDLAAYVESRIAMAIAKAMDKAILKGTGITGKQPEGIIPKVTATSNGTKIVDILAAIGALDTGDDYYDMGEVVAVMKRSTYYKHIMPNTLINTADGRTVVKMAGNASLPDGTRVIFSEYMDADKILLGGIKNGYMLAERKGMALAKSTEVRFLEDQTVFKGTARYDGKVIRPEMFALVTMSVAPGV